MLQQKTSYVAPVFLTVSLPDERLRQKPRAFVAERLRTHRQVDGRAAVKLYGRRSGPGEPAVEACVADVAPRLAFEPAFFFQARLPIGSGQHPRADGDRKHDDDGGAAVALKFRHIHAPRHAHTLYPT